MKNRIAIAAGIDSDLRRCKTEGRQSRARPRGKAAVLPDAPRLAGEVADHLMDIDDELPGLIAGKAARAQPGDRARAIAGSNSRAAD
jgi:hypothetical protein